MPKYRYVGTVAREVQVGDKVIPVGPGDFVTMSAEQLKEAEENGLRFIEEKKGGDK